MRTVRAAVAAICAGAVLAGCGTGPAKPTPTPPLDPAVQMQADDCGTTSCPNAGSESDYRRAITALLARCSDIRDGHGVATAIREARTLLAQHGHRYTELAILEGVTATIPAGPRVRCVDQIGTYVATLE